MSDLPIRSARLVLDRLVAADAEDFRRIVTIPEVGRMLFIFPTDYTTEAAAALIARDADPARRPLRLAIRRPGSDRLWGAIGLGAGDRPDIYYFLDPAAAGQGLMREAVALFLPFVRARFALPALGAKVFTDNPASVRVLEANGFKRVGHDEVQSAQRDELHPVWLYRAEYADPHAPLE
ncbi:GNAT family N-acetyltransferase [Sedimentimonas flavescens]|uniref:GNAT family N-acetyltransferase n=1 Tax=Sedimentimonas flavescens TaxID=2851012 RepID=A0ABT2ZYI2_9RHOB|nr:GNAT family N-acetyltransferase [Sedimentimonas flavescens]MCV2878713.1 GNAT family N-acetyltransferase [Sedimentimonas flavescens]